MDGVMSLETAAFSPETEQNTPRVSDMDILMDAVSLFWSMQDIYVKQNGKTTSKWRHVAIFILKACNPSSISM